jgi:hypothetical protein
MTEETFEPLRMLAELNALGVRYVLVGDLASEGAGSVLTTDRLEICVADDDDDIDLLRAMLVALEAEQDGPSDDPHRAMFRTRLGRLDCLEMAADAEFAELERRAGHVDFGNGVIVRAAPQLDPRAHASPDAFLEVNEPGPEPHERTPVPRRIWQKLEPKLERIDDVLSGLGGRGRGDPPDLGR